MINQQLLEAKLRLIANSVRLDGECYIFFKRAASNGEVVDFEIIFAANLEPIKKEGMLPQPPENAYMQVVNGFVKRKFTSKEVLRIGPKGLPLEQS